MAAPDGKKYTPTYHESVVPVVQRQTSSGATFDDLAGGEGNVGSIEIQVVDENVVAALNQPTTLQCRVPLWREHGGGGHVRWLHDGRPCEEEKYVLLRDGGLQYLYIKETSLADAGTYVVVAEDGDARAEKMIDVRIAQPKPPTSDEKSRTSISMKHFPDYVKKLHSSNDIVSEFFGVELQWDVTQHTANLECNMHKNRYCNVFPYDHTRVVLSLLDGVPGSDYINASHIRDEIGGGRYIASQGPLPHTYADFWRMVWEQDVHVIAMVTKSSHHFGYQEASYWPEEVNQEVTFDGVVVTMTDREETRHWIRRSITMHNKLSAGKGLPENRAVVHFQFISWPEYGVPKRPTDLLTFRQKVIDCHNKTTGPLLVHCSAGVGRTGTFICIDMLTRRLSLTSKVDVFSVVRELRFKRERTVETPEQYILVHEALAEIL